jgi:hypothetical protein
MDEFADSFSASRARGPYFLVLLEIRVRWGSGAVDKEHVLLFFGLSVLTYDAMGGDGEGEDDSFGPHYDTPPVSYKKLLPPGVLHPGMPDVRAVKPATTNEDQQRGGADEDGDGVDGKAQKTGSCSLHFVNLN